LGTIEKPRPKRGTYLRTASALRQGETWYGLEGLAKKLIIVDATFYIWRKKL